MFTTVEKMMPEKALVRLLEKSLLERLRDLKVIRIGYDRGHDWELGEVEMIGDSDLWDGIEIGDRVIMRAGGTHEQSGGPAGSDVSRVLGEHRGTHIVIDPHEVIAKVEHVDG